MHSTLGAFDQLITYAQEALVERRGKQNADRNDAILFLGNRHETVPRKLLIDERLGSTEKIAWQMIQLLANDLSRVAFPTYEQLRPLLRSRAGESASKATVNRVISILRLTRWLTLGKRVRDPNNGYVLGNVYLLHDEPLTAAECNQVDPEYFEFVLKSLSHQNKSIAEAAESVVDDVIESGLKVPSRLEVIFDRVNTFTEFSSRTQSKNNDLTLSSRGEPSEYSQRTKLSSRGEPSLKSTGYDSVLVENPVPTVVSKVSNSIVSTTSLEWHSVFSTMETNVLDTFMNRVKEIPDEIKQPVVDECAGRLLLDKTIKKPGPYLASIVMRALTNRFNLSEFGKHIQSLRSPEENVTSSEMNRDDESSSSSSPTKQPSKQERRKSITESVMNINDTDW